jgi:hypothetical protein
MGLEFGLLLLKCPLQVQLAFAVLEVKLTGLARLRSSIGNDCGSDIWQFMRLVKSFGLTTIKIYPRK